MRRIIIFISLALISAGNVVAQESRAENNLDYNFQESYRVIAGVMFPAHD